MKQQKKKLKEKQEAEKRAKALADLDDEFGIGSLVTCRSHFKPISIFLSLIQIRGTSATDTHETN